MKKIASKQLFSIGSFLPCLRIVFVFFMWLAVSRIPLEAQDLHWLSEGAIVRHEVLTGTTTSLGLSGFALTLSSDVPGGQLFHFREAGGDDNSTFSSGALFLFFVPVPFCILDKQI